MPSGLVSVTPEGDPVQPDADTSEANRREEPTAREADASRGPSSSSTQSTEPASSEGPSQAEIDRAAEVLLTRVRQQPSEQRVGETTIPDGPLGEKLLGFATYCGRDEGYLNRVLDVKSVSGIGELTVGQVPDVLGVRVLPVLNLAANGFFLVGQSHGVGHEEEENNRFYNARYPEKMRTGL